MKSFLRLVPARLAVLTASAGLCLLLAACGGSEVDLGEPSSGLADRVGERSLAADAQRVAASSERQESPRVEVPAESWSAERPGERPIEFGLPCAADAAQASPEPWHQPAGHAADSAAVAHAPGASAPQPGPQREAVAFKQPTAEASACASPRS